MNWLKPPIKRLRHQLRTAYVTRFHSFTPGDFRATIADLGVRPGDVLCVHSSFDQFLGFRGNVGHVIETLQDCVGGDGGIMMPTQPFNGTTIEYIRTHPITDLARAPSLMGLMTEVLRRTPGASRSINPTHPVAVWGEKGLQLLGRDWEAGTPCGRGTAYYRLLEAGGKLLMLGTGVQPMTFYHCIEELIEPLMPFSPFTREEFVLQARDRNGTLYTSRMRLYEPRLSARRRMNLMVPELQRLGAWAPARVGRLQVILLRAMDVLEACRSMATAGRFCYLPETN